MTVCNLNLHDAVPNCPNSYAPLHAGRPDKQGAGVVVQLISLDTWYLTTIRYNSNPWFTNEITTFSRSLIIIHNLSNFAIQKSFNSVHQFQPVFCTVGKEIYLHFRILIPCCKRRTNWPWNSSNWMQFAVSHFHCILIHHDAANNNVTCFCSSLKINDLCF